MTNKGLHVSANTPLLVLHCTTALHQAQKGTQDHIHDSRYEVMIQFTKFVRYLKKTEFIAQIHKWKEPPSVFCHLFWRTSGSEE